MYDKEKIKITIEMLNESDLKGELDDNELIELEDLKKIYASLTNNQNDEKEMNQQNPKQVIIVNKKLNMPSGKLAAQVSHASLGALFKWGLKNDEMLHIDLRTGTAVEKWLNGRFTKIVLYVKSDEKLQSIYKKAIDRGLPSVIITDAGFTIFDGKPTRTCVGIGPVFPDDLIGITDKLRVL